jgi:short-subunit dehydrogenase
LTTLSTSNKTALITGASSGIGMALAHQFAQDGYQLVLAARGVAKMQALADELQRTYKVTVTVIAADLETHDGAAGLHADIKARGIVLSALVNNAGYGAFGEFKDSALMSELAMMQLNMNTVVVLTKLFMPDLLATRGKILNTASTAAFQPGPYMAVYYATKSFVLSFSEAIAELGYRAMQRGQRVYIPGFVNWAMAQSMRFTPRNLATKVVKILTRPIL